MPHSKTHEERKVKNYIIFALLLGLVILFFGITIVRLGG